MSFDPAIRVVKIGGSLLDLPDLSERLHHWPAQRPDRHDVWIVGGGKLVDALRARSIHERMNDYQAHWTAIELMGNNAHYLARRLQDVPLCPFALLLDRAKHPGTTLLEVVDFMQNVEPHAAGLKLPASWDVTSDSIAGRAAIVLAASELVLLKSAPSNVLANASLAELVGCGIVDPFLPRLVDALPMVTLVDFRSQSPVSSTL